MNFKSIFLLFFTYFFLLAIQQVSAITRYDTISVFSWNNQTDEWIGERQIINQFKNNKLKEHLVTVHDTLKNSWIQSKKITYQYTINDKKNLQIEYIYDEEMNQQIKHTKTEYNYIGDLLQQKTSFKFDQINNSWIESGKRSYGYNPNNKLTDQAYYKWDQQMDIWREQHVDSFRYQNEHLTRWKHLVYDADKGWMPQRMHTYSYEGNQLVERMEYVYDSHSRVPSRKSVFSYTNENRTEWILYTYNQSSSNWLRKRKFLYTYTNDTLKGWTSYTWNHSFNEWQYHWSSDYMYNANAQLEEIMNSKWAYDINKDSSRWLDDDKFAYTYNDNQSLKELIFYDDTALGNLEKSKRVFYGSYATQNIKQIPLSNEIKLYPNPSFENHIYVEYPETVTINQITIFDYLGKPLKMINHDIVNRPYRINTRNIHSRILMVKIITANGAKITKRIINY
jgi:hypothetical protein